MVEPPKPPEVPDAPRTRGAAGARKWNSWWSRRSPNLRTNDNPPVRAGIDVGSKTVKLVTLDANGSIVHGVYHRHRSDVRYLEQLRAFRDAGVERVIYLQSFGCLKGHVKSRGAAHELAALFPEMPVTVIDYDPESSALNRENRIRLALVR